jgi:hypothetical protein
MSRFLHLRALTGRDRGPPHISGHALNPAVQAHLGCIPALSLPMVYRQGEACLWRRVCRGGAASAGRDFAALQEDILFSGCRA